MIERLPPQKTPPPARVLIVDDHDLARAGLRAVLAAETSVKVVGEATDGREAVRLARGMHPDLILMDVRMPDMDGLSATRAIKEELPSTSVIMITMYEDPDYLLEALKAGAAGYLLKDASQHDIVTAVRQVLRGDSPISSKLASQLLRRLAKEQAGPQGQLLEPLTPREREVLHHVAEGKTNREIARELFVSPGTVKIHVEHIIRKLGVSDRTQAAVRAIQLGLISPSAA